MSERYFRSQVPTSTNGAQIPTRGTDSATVGGCVLSNHPGSMYEIDALSRAITVALTNDGGWMQLLWSHGMKLL